MPNYAHALENSAAIVTGAGRGLGRAHAMRLAMEGAAVVVNDVDFDAAQAVVEEIINAGGRAIADGSSISDPTAAATLVEACKRKFGGIHVLVCNAGIANFGGIASAPMEDLRAIVDVNLWGSVFPVRAAWPYMLKQKYGRIILTTSQAGLWGYQEMSGYAMTKAALIGLGRAVRGEVPADCNIHINLIAPCALTRLSEASIPKELHERMRPENVSPLVAFLASSRCRESGMIFNVGAGRMRRVRILESEAAELPAEGIDSLPPELADIADLPEPGNMLEAGSHILPDLGAGN